MRGVSGTDNRRLLVRVTPWSLVVRLGNGVPEIPEEPENEPAVSYSQMVSYMIDIRRRGNDTQSRHAIEPESNRHVEP